MRIPLLAIAALIGTGSIASAQRGFRPQAVCSTIDGDLAAAIDEERKARDALVPVARAVHGVQRPDLERKVAELDARRQSLRTDLDKVSAEWNRRCCDGTYLRCETRPPNVFVEAVDADDPDAAARVEPCRRAFAQHVRPRIDTLASVLAAYDAAKRALDAHDAKLRDGRRFAQRWVEARDRLAALKTRRDYCDSFKNQDRNWKQEKRRLDWMFDRAAEHEGSLGNPGTAFFGLGAK